MELPSSEWLSQLEMDDTISDVDPQAVDQLVESLSKDLENSDLQFNHEGYNPVAGTLAFGRMSSLNFSHGNPAPSHQVIRWGDEEVQSINLKVLEKSNAKASSSRTPHYSEEHVLAEKKRREKLSQQFLALATLVPELKKTDKVSLLEGTIDYLKALEQKVENLEKTRRRGRENKASSVLVADKNDRNNPEELLANSEALPKVEASLEGNTILIRIQCEKRKGVLVRVLSEMDKLCLSVINTNVVQFGTSHNMTITTEKEEGFSLTVDDVIRNLNSAIRQFDG